MSDLATRRSLPATRRSWGPDPAMLCPGIAGVVAGVLAYLAVAARWVHLTVTVAPTEFEEGQILQLTLRAGVATIGTIATGLAIALIAFGAVWFCFGLQRGWTMPGITNPLFAMLLTIAGMATGVPVRDGLVRLGGGDGATGAARRLVASRHARTPGSAAEPRVSRSNGSRVWSRSEG